MNLNFTSVTRLGLVCKAWRRCRVVIRHLRLGRPARITAKGQTFSE